MVRCGRGRRGRGGDGRGVGGRRLRRGGVQVFSQLLLLKHLLKGRLAFYESRERDPVCVGVWGAVAFLVMVSSCILKFMFVYAYLTM